jgi:hypothetical protein
MAIGHRDLSAKRRRIRVTGYGYFRVRTRLAMEQIVPECDGL